MAARRSMKWQVLVVATLYAIPTAGVLCAAVAWAADTPIDVIATSPAWVGTTLLGSVLAIVLGKFLPDLMKQLAIKDQQLITFCENKDKQLLAMIEAKDRQIAEVVTKQETAIGTVIDQFTVMNERQRTEFRETLEIVQAHHAREVSGLGTATSQALQTHAKSIDGFTAAARGLEAAITKGANA